MPRKRSTKLLGSAARTAGPAAVISGTATAVSGRVARRQQRTLDGNAATERPAAGSLGSGDDLVAGLRELAALREKGALTEREYAAAKARLLAI